MRLAILTPFLLIAAVSAASAEKPPNVPDAVWIDTTQLDDLVSSVDISHYPDLPYKRVEAIVNNMNTVRVCTKMQVPQNGVTTTNSNSPCKAVAAAQQEHQRALAKAADDGRAAQKAEDDAALTKAVAEAKAAQKLEDGK